MHLPHSPSRGLLMLAMSSTAVFSSFVSLYHLVSNYDNIETTSRASSQQLLPEQAGMLQRVSQRQATVG